MTLRHALLAALRNGEKTALELSGEVSATEKDVVFHLEHLAKTLRSRGERLVVTPSHCLACGFSFKKRDRLSTPGKCPTCSSERITPPRFSVG
jgi:transcriptional regulator